MVHKYLALESPIYIAIPKVNFTNLVLQL